VGDEIHVLRGNVVLLHHLVQHLHDARSHTLLGAVGGGGFHGADKLIGVVVDGDGIGKGAAYVNANANLHLLTSRI